MSKGKERIVLTRNAFHVYLTTALIAGINLPVIYVALVGWLG